MPTFQSGKSRLAVLKVARIHSTMSSFHLHNSQFALDCNVRCSREKCRWGGFKGNLQESSSPLPKQPSGSSEQVCYCSTRNIPLVLYKKRQRHSVQRLADPYRHHRLAAAGETFAPVDLKGFQTVPPSELYKSLKGSFKKKRRRKNHCYCLLCPCGWPMQRTACCFRVVTRA